MKTLLMLPVTALILTLATPTWSEAQTSEVVSRLEARVAELEKRLAAVEASLTRIEAAVSGAAPVQSPQVSASSNTRLSQGSAENTIRAYAAERPIVFRGGGNGCSLTPQSIAAFGPLSQFSDAQASTVVALGCARPGVRMPITVVFQKDVNGRWFLTRFDYDAQFQVDAQIIMAINESLRVPYAAR